MQVADTSVQAGLAKRMKPKTRTAQGTAAPTNYASRFKNPGAGSNMSRTATGDFQNRPAPQARRAVRWQPRARPAAMKPMRPAPAPAYPAATPAPVRPAYPPPGGGYMPTMPTGSTYQPTAAQNPGHVGVPNAGMVPTPVATPQPVPPQYQPPGRPVAPVQAQAAYPAPAPAAPTGPRWPGDTTWWRPNPEPSPTPAYNPTPYNTYRR